MNSRARLLLALSGGIPDRVPVSTYELVGYDSRAWENAEPSYAPLMEVIRAETDCVCMWNPASNEVFLSSAHPVEMGVQISREGDTVTTRRILHTLRGDLTQTTHRADRVHTTWQTEHWCKSLDDVDAALSAPYQPVQYDFSDLARISAEVGERGIVMASLSDPLYLAADLMEFGAYTVWALTEPAHFENTLCVLHQRNMQNLRNMFDTGAADCSSQIDLFRICGPEYATPPFLPPRLFERFVVPYVTEMVDLIHSYGAKARFHCHGRIGEVLDMILSTGADALDPCEAPPDGDIELAEIKRRIGGRMCLFGNLQLKLLEYGTPGEVEATVKRCMDAAKAGGGYVIMPTAAPIDVPLSPKTVKNYLRFIETALACGQY
ncbi:MAG: hypothetical protein JW934_10130 [Anaerolineae bacterium]|nr:hypothetical protein [Anaerolineae bacterium]